MQRLPLSEDSVVLWVRAKKVQPLLASPAVLMEVHLVAYVSYRNIYFFLKMGLGNVNKGHLQSDS